MGAVAAPAAPAAQHLTALAKANRVRLLQAAAKRKIASGELAVADALVDPDLGTMRLDDLIRAQHRWGRARTVRLLRQAGVPEKKPVVTLTPRQRSEVVRLLDLANGGGT